MYNKDEKDIFSFIDSLDDESELNSILKDIEITICDSEIPYEIEVDKIKQKTLNKIDQETLSSVENIRTMKINNNNKKSRRFNIKSITRRNIVAVVILLALLGSMFNNNVSAMIKKMFNYIPGINMIMENENLSNLYILDEEVKVNLDDSYVEIKSLIIDNERNAIYLTAYGSSKKWFKNVWVLINNEKYHLDSYNLSGSTRVWEGNYRYIKEFTKESKKDVFFNEEDNIKIIFGKNSELVIPVRLKLAKNYDSFEELGPTKTINDLTITAIPNFDGDLLNIKLLTPNYNDRRVFEYGLRPSLWKYKYVEGLSEKNILLDKNNNEIAEVTSVDIYNYYSTLQYDLSNNEDNEYILTIPFVKMNYRVDEKHKIKLPELGEKFIYDDYVIEISDYKFKILEVEKYINADTNTEIAKLTVDTYYNAKHSDVLYDIRIESRSGLFRDPLFNSMTHVFEVKENGEFGSLKEIHIGLEKSNINTLPIYIEEITTIKRGPWKFNIVKPE